MRRNGAKKSKVSNARVDTLIGYGTEINGDLGFKGGLHINGTVKGNVYAEENTQSVAIISEQGRIEGDLHVPSLLINGHIVGNVHADSRVDLASNARIHGDVYYRTMEMASGAEVNGKLICTDDGPQRYLERQEHAAPLTEEAESEVPSTETGAQTQAAETESQS